MLKKQRNVLLISLGIALAIFACVVTIILVKVNTKKDEPTTTDDGSLKYVAMLDFELNADESGYLISGKDPAAGDIIIPRTYNGKPVVGIADNAFYGSTELTSVKILNGSNMSIGDYAFYDCSNLTSVTLSDSVTSLGNGVFGYCRKLTNITIPENVTSIGNMAFYSSGLTSITIPSSVTSIGGAAFWCCGITSVTFENTSGWFVADSSSATSGTDLSSTDLANTETAATYLTSTYYIKYWKRAD